MCCLVKCLLCKHEDPSLTPGIPFQIARCVIYTCNPSIGGDRDKQTPGNHWPVSLAFLTRSKPVRDFVTKKAKKKKKKMVPEKQL